MLRLTRLVFGAAQFDENDDYRRFQYQLLCAVMTTGALLTGILIAGAESGANPIDPRHVSSMYVFTTSSLLLWLVLRGHPSRYLPVAWMFEALCLLEYVSALMYVPEDEMRLIWFLTNVPGVYILLGQRAGGIITLLSACGLAVGNAFLPEPYSRNALATSLLGILYLGVFFHIYGARSISYFVQMRESNRQLHHLANHDMLTGLLNARAYYASCERMIHLAQRQNRPCAVLFVDLDHFKTINDTHGHAAGDAVLQQVARTLQESVRKSDAVGRIGGEEFSIFLPDTPQDGAVRLAESIRARIENLMPDIGSRRLRITASIGVACNGDRLLSMQEIQRRADQAMYRAKCAGRNRVSSLDETSERIPA